MKIAFAAVSKRDFLRALSKAKVKQKKKSKALILFSKKQFSGKLYFIYRVYVDCGSFNLTDG